MEDSSQPISLAEASGAKAVPISQADTYRRPSQTPAQREALLSLFGKSGPSPKPSPAELNLQTSVPKHSATPSVVSPLTPHHQPAGNEPSNSDRVASPANKAFLLGFLEGVAKGSK
jgi:mRNA-decapping enzyme subunit 2